MLLISVPTEGQYFYPRSSKSPDITNLGVPKRQGFDKADILMLLGGTPSLKIPTTTRSDTRNWILSEVHIHELKTAVKAAQKQKPEGISGTCSDRHEEEDRQHLTCQLDKVDLTCRVRNQVAIAYSFGVSLTFVQTNPLIKDSKLSIEQLQSAGTSFSGKGRT